jgi:yeast amino acid transporter
MITIAGAIGRSLFVGSCEALYISGLAPLLGAYIVMCALVYGIVTCTSEMNAYLPIPGCSMAYYATRFCSRSLGFALGYLYWYSFGK